MVMKRFAMDYLIDWQSRTRKPLVIRGARQVGKSYLVRDFGQRHFENYLEINCETLDGIAELFASNNIKSILKSLEIEFEITIKPGKTLLFFDEIQAFPALFPKLRYFYEEYPDLHIIAAGSLLDFLLEEHNFSMPVGRIEYMYMGPMSFNEFLHAAGKRQLLNYLDNYSLDTEFSVIIHHKLAALFRQYIYLGGMPEVIKTYLESESYRNAEIVKQAIIKTYQDDFVKYKKRINYSLLVKVFLQLPRNIAKKIKYVNILRDERSKSIADSIHLFSQARIINIIKHTNANGSPLGAEVKNGLFKIIFLDVGLMLAMNGLTYNDIKNMEHRQLVNLGDVCEQFTGQHLLYSKEAFYEPELYYWQREHKNSAAEIDYLIAESATIIPIEVKSGKTGQLKSLHQFIKAKQSPLAVRLNMDLPTLLNTENCLPDGNTVSYKLLSLPIYMIEQLRRLIRTQL